MSNAKKAILATLLITVALVFSGCSSMFGLRKDLDNEQFADNSPTSGGRWAEGGMLDDEARANSGRNWNRGQNDRNPASEAAPDYRVGDRSWVSKQQPSTYGYDNIARHDNDATGDAQEIAARDATAVGSKVEKRKFKNGERATRWDFVDEAKNDGSLWGGDGQANFFFTKNKVRSQGDIITVVSDADLVRDLSTEVLRTLTKDERSQELDLAQERLNTDSVKSSSAGADRAPASAAKNEGKKDEGNGREATLADIDLSKSLGFKAGDPILAEIVERYPNGNYKLRGSKKVPYKGGFRYVTMLGIVRGQDVADDDTVQSGKLYEYRLEALR